MLKYYCDRCYKEIPDEEISRIMIDRPDRKQRFEYERYNNAEYCSDCAGKLLDILREWGNMRNEAGD